MCISVKNIVPEYPVDTKTIYFPDIELVKNMKILLLGSGGREHALAWKISQSPKVEKLYIAPGNAGTREVGENVALSATDFEGIKAFVLANNINMVVVGPEDPLVKGVYDFFRDDELLNSIPVIGPSKEGAMLEGSKDFAKAFMMRHGIPTARYQTFTQETLDEGIAFLRTLEAPYVLKADGLCAGKGVLILDTIEEAEKELREMLGGMFGSASASVVIEEFLSGVECSVFVLTDGKNYKLLPEAKDYKRIGEGDTGLNTGGMGSISPVPFADAAWMQKVEERIVRPTVEGLAAEGIDYIELGGVRPNPRSGLVYEGIDLCRKENVDFILAVGGGSCSDALMDVIQAGCDTFITADVKYNGFWDAQEQGVTLIDAGHFYTENPICSVLAEKIASAFPEVEVVLSAKHADCMKFY